MKQSIDYEKTLRETIIETLVPETDEIVGFVVEDPQLQQIGWWIVIDGRPAFFGRTFKAAIFTAKQGDWFVPPRDGTLIPLVIDWFEKRADDPLWVEVETQEQRNSRRERTTCNAELTSDELNYEPRYNPERDIGSSISNQEVDPMIEEQVNNPAPVTSLREVEILEIRGYDGHWILDDEVEVMQKVRVNVKEDGWGIFLGEKIPAVSGMEMRTVLRVKMDSQTNLIAVKMFGPNGKDPILVLKRHGEVIRLDRLTLL